MYYMPPLITSLWFLFLGIFVFVKNKESNTNKCFMFLCLATFIWQFSWFILFSSMFKGLNTTIINIGYSGIIFIPIVYYHFLATFLNRQKKESLLINFSYFAGLIFLYLLWGTRKFISGSYDYYWGPYPEAGIIHPAYLLLLVFLAMRGVYILAKGLRDTNTTGRYNQIKYVFFSLLFYIPASSDFIVNYGKEFYPIGFIFILISFAIIAYAIVRHQLLNIEIIIKKTLVFAGLFVASYAVFTSFAYLGSVVFENVVKNRWIAMAPSVLVVVLMLRPLENFLRNATDRYLFQKKYDYKQLLKTFTEEVLTVLDLQNLVNLTVNKLADIIKLENASILLQDEEKNEFKIVVSAGLEDAEYELPDEEKVVTYLRETGKYILLDDIEQKKLLGKQIEKTLSDLQADLVIPLLRQRSMIGILSLGKKKSDEEFTQDDIDILLPLAKTLAIAITNAQLFEKLSEAQAQAAQREKMAVIGTLSAGINHEICNPLGITRGLCEMFLLNLEEGVYKDKTPQELLKKAREIMEKIIHETDRATVITRKLSSFAKPSKGVIEGDVKLEKELDEVIALVEHDLKLDNIAVIKEFEEDLPLIAADRKQVQEIFFNIIRNAAQSIAGSGKITIRAFRDNKKVRVDIEDTGTGITSDNLERIFDPFFTTKEPGKGTGLGLFIVRQIVERNNGQIFVRSKPEKGTIFTLTFEIMVPEEDMAFEAKSGS